MPIFCRGARPPGLMAAGEEKGDGAWCLLRALELSADRFVWTWLHREDVGRIISAAARSTFVLCGPGGSGSLAAELVAARLEPTIIMPDGRRSTQPTGRILIGWDDAVRRPIGDLLPLLRRADHIELLVAEADSLVCAQALRHLRDFGLGAVLRVVPSDIEISEFLARTWSQLRADWLILSRARDIRRGPWYRSLPRLIADPICPLIVGC